MRRGLITALMPLVLFGCASPGDYSELAVTNESLRDENQRLRATLAERDRAIDRMRGQVKALQSFGSDRPADLFAPVKIELASLSGGADYDGRPGDDGVTVYVRPRDADGDVVKAPGRITIQLLDNTNMATPAKLAVCVEDNPEHLRRVWYGRFGTGHYKVDCPFDPDRTPASSHVTVSVEFVDYLTGSTLRAVKEVSVSLPPR